MFSFLMSFTLLQLFFEKNLLADSTFQHQLCRSPKYAILIPMFYMTKPSQPYFP